MIVKGMIEPVKISGRSSISLPRFSADPLGSASTLCGSELRSDRFSRGTGRYGPPFNGVSSGTILIRASVAQYRVLPNSLDSLVGKGGA